MMYVIHKVFQRWICFYFSKYLGLLDVTSFSYDARKKKVCIIKKFNVMQTKELNENITMYTFLGCLVGCLLIKLFLFAF